MAKEILLKLNKNSIFRLKLGGYDFSFKGIITKLIMLSELVLAGYLTLAFAAEYLFITLSVGSISLLYYAVVTLIALQILKLILSRTDFFPTLNYDLQSLLAISFIALSLCINIIILRNPQNVWGGVALKGLSGISIIAGWFLYYLIGTTFLRKNGAKQVVSLIGIAMLFACLTFIINLRAVNVTGLADLFILLSGGIIWIILTQKRLSYVALANIFLTIIMLPWASAGAKVAAYFSFFFTAATIIYIKRKTLLASVVSMDSDTEEVIQSGSGIMKYLRANSAMMYLTLSALIAIIGGVMLVVNGSELNLSALFVNGANTFAKNTNVGIVLIGSGLAQTNTTTFFAVLNGYGLLAVLAFSALVVWMFKNLFDLLSRVREKTEKGIIFFVLTTLVSICAFFMLYTPLDMVFILFWMLVALTAILVEQHIRHRELKMDFTPRKFSDITDLNIREFKQLLQIIGVVGVIALLVLAYLAINSVIPYLAR